MCQIVRLRGFSAVLCVSLLTFALPLARATMVPRLSFEELTDSSDLVVSGSIIRSWAAWDSGHKYIWTHYEISVASAPKGKTAATVEFAEPGGTLDGVAHAIAGAVSYRPGEQVVVFLQRMPNGYLRTTGWGQGKYSLDSAGRVHGSALRAAEVVDLRQPARASTSLETLDGMSLRDLALRVSARVRGTAPTAGGAK